MRKIQQKQILDVLKTIDEAQVNGFYADCQEGALAIGEFIEGIAGEGTQTVSLLEEYCDLLYQACNGKVSVKTLTRHIIKVENSVKNELKPNKIEAVFLPYKVSMWDSLESVYLAAKGDPDCDAYVVPIPSYELNPNGTLGKMYYDGEEYPDDIPIINWQDYDIEARQPDIIFIHYAYDDFVNNATIHPIFYSERLRQNCQQLIYIPYFVSMVDVTVDYNALLPGVLNSHHVILESEAMRNSYIDFYEKYDKEYGWSGRYGKAEYKFLALGSPKFDKVISSKYEDFRIPDKWAELISNPDGTKKKAILFNTHMFIWLEGGEQYFKKLRYIFETFKTRNDVVLWWRPHPNTEINFRTKYPQWLDEYLDIVSIYKNEGWGIYDDTPDLHRAIACTDAYYGDKSSLISLYKTAQKPILINNLAIFADELNIPISEFHITGEHIWFSLRYFNALFRLRRSDLELEFVGSFPNEKNIADYYFPLYYQTAELNNKLYFSPFLAKEIAVFSIDNNTFEKIPHQNMIEDEESEFAFAGAVTYGKYVFFTPCSYPAILRLDTETRELTYYSGWVKPLKEKIKDEKKNFFLESPAMVENTLWLASCSSNTVMSFDMETCTYEIFEVGNKEYRYQNMCYDGQCFWLTPLRDTHTPIAKWHPQSGVLKEFNEISDHIEASGCFNISRYGDGYIWLFPTSGRKGTSNIIKIDVNSDIVHNAEEFEEVIYEGYGHRFLSSQIVGDYLYIFHALKGTVQEYNLRTEANREVKLEYNKKTETKLLPKAVELFCSEDAFGKPLMENNIARLESYISHIAEDSISITSHLTSQVTTDGKAGLHIYDYVKKRLLTV